MMDRQLKLMNPKKVQQSQFCNCHRQVRYHQLAMSLMCDLACEHAVDAKKLLEIISPGQRADLEQQILREALRGAPY
jgi:cell fate regulator YaaT (PSP1 superfamily)